MLCGFCGIFGFASGPIQFLFILGFMFENLGLQGLRLFKFIGLGFITRSGFKGQDFWTSQLREGSYVKIQAGAALTIMMP